MTVRMSRHDAYINGRRVHYRKWGTGPALVLLHASPVSSQVFERDYAPVFAKRFTCIAPDTPGNGLSTPLKNASDATLDDYAAALVAFMDEIGIENCILYGRHTGALIAHAASLLQPGRASLVYADGFPAFQPPLPPEAIDTYLATPEPDWTGSFLTWLWFRYRDQHTFWSWYQQDDAHRSDTDIPDLDFLHRGVRDLLLSGSEFRHPYRAAFEAGGELSFRETKVPTCFAIRPGDSLLATQDALTDLQPDAWREELPRDTRDAIAREFDILTHYADGLADYSLPPGARLTSGTGSCFVNVAGGQLFCRYHISQKPNASALLMIPTIPGGSTGLATVFEAFSSTRTVIMFDPPGHGDSVIDTPHTIEAYASTLIEGLQALGVDIEEIYTFGSGNLVAREVARQMPIQSIRQDEPFELGALARDSLINHYTEDFSPAWDGSHLLKLWHQLRDERLWRPWNQRTIENRILDSKAYALDLHYGAFLDCLKQVENVNAGWRAVLSYDHAASKVPAATSIQSVSMLYNTNTS